jgi:hypothetical protein
MEKRVKQIIRIIQIQEKNIELLMQKKSDIERSIDNVNQLIEHLDNEHEREKKILAQMQQCYDYLSLYNRYKSKKDNYFKQKHDFEKQLQELIIALRKKYIDQEKFKHIADEGRKILHEAKERLQQSELDEAVLLRWVK